MSTDSLQVIDAKDKPTGEIMFLGANTLPQIFEPYERDTRWLCFLSPAYYLGERIDANQKYYRMDESNGTSHYVVLNYSSWTMAVIDRGSMLTLLHGAWH